MIFSRKTEDTNYWPSISDMFLVFFIIALGMLAFNSNNKGDALILEFLEEESNHLFARFQDIEEYQLDLDAENDLKRPILAARIMQADSQYRTIRRTRIPADCIKELLKSSGVSVNDAGEPVDEDDEPLPLDEDELTSRAENDYHLAIRTLAWRVLVGGKSKATSWQKAVERFRKKRLKIEEENPGDTHLSVEKLQLQMIFDMRTDTLLRHTNNALQAAGFAEKAGGGGTMSPEAMRGLLNDYLSNIKSWNSNLRRTLGVTTEVTAAPEAIIADMQQNVEAICRKVKELTEVNERLRKKSGITDYLPKIRDWHTTLSAWLHKPRKANPDVVSETDAMIQELHNNYNAIGKKYQTLLEENKKLKQVSVDTREQHVVLDENKVSFIKNKLKFSDEDAANKALETAVTDLRKNMWSNFERSDSFIIEIIGHTDYDGSDLEDYNSVEETIKENKDDPNPRLGMQRAFTIYTKLKAKLGNTYTKDGQKKQIKYRCYSGSWVNPIEDDEYGVDDEAQCSRNRRVEVYLRPVTPQLNTP